MHSSRFMISAILAVVAICGAMPAYSSTDKQEPFEISLAEIEQVPPKFRRTAVTYVSGERPGTIVVDTVNRHLYLITSRTTAMRYGIGVGRQGFSWAGRAVIRRKAEWPRWTPPAEMVARDPEAAKWAGGMPGGPTNPLGARALYLFQGKVDTLYRIHGTFEVSSIGRAVSSGCIRLLNADIADLYERVALGTPVVVLSRHSNPTAEKKRPTKKAVPVERRRSTKKTAPAEKEQLPSTLVRRNFNLDL